MPSNASDATASATEIRKQKRAQRRALSDVTQIQHAVALRKNLIKERHYHNSKNIGCYLANDGEIDPSLLTEHAWFAKKNLYLPILSPLKDQLHFAPYNSDSRFKLNRFNIPEPICHPSQWKTAKQLDLLLLPLVAFDSTGNRIGMGGGFYDRTLAYLSHRQYWKKPTLIGLAHELQKVEQLKSQNWDIPLNYILTEKQLYKG